MTVTDSGDTWLATVLASQRSGPRQRLWARLQEGDAEVEVELPGGAGLPAYPTGSQIRLAPSRFGVFAAGNSSI
jgi:sulfate transport system ATP-binding protein